MDYEKSVEQRERQEKNARQSLTLPLNVAIIPPFFSAENQEKRLAQKVLGLQLLVTLVAGTVAYGQNGSMQHAVAVLAGGGISVLNGAMLAWRMFRARLQSSQDAHQQLRLMYFCAVERFLVIVVSLGVCMTVLGLAPLAVLSGFVLGQTVLLSARLFLKIKTEDSD